MESEGQAEGDLRAILHELEDKYKETEENYMKWEGYGKEYEKLRSFLVEISKTTRRSYFVPFSEKGFIPGVLIHTNEILVLFGENWFVERSSSQAVDIVDRRVEYVNSCLKVLDKKRKELKNRLERVAKKSGEKIYNEEGLPIVEIREELNEDGSIANSEIFDNLGEDWLKEASDEIMRKFNIFSNTSEECEISTNNAGTPTKYDVNKDYSVSNVDKLDDIERIIDIMNELELNEDENEYSSDSEDSEDIENDYERTCRSISPVCPDNSSKTCKSSKKVTFSDDIVSLPDDNSDHENEDTFKEENIKPGPIIKDVVERPCTQSTEDVLDNLTSSLHRREIATEYYKLKQKFRAQIHSSDTNSHHSCIEDKNSSKKISRFKAAIMDRKI
ncbi:hypothetical protein T552_02861 [Pneumocystis carinii B80]|uniref:DUF3835 domain-containing protein n=1 Tax=Pneumocystis carinii (strain B80) TaxID=1408658 RepID=A0A0W4ZDB8_PNEC8|nr:hypothetical protein T552_02861 [Pneumocystis carinii B80]KTW26379.1 hypothetical protein T552_02861 [Pneumocystis carinii B80]